MEKVVIDKNMCIGCGFCAANYSDVFKMDDDDLAVTANNIIDKMDDKAKEEILDIKDGCPVGAIKIEHE